ncbi:MAG: ABC transporter permease [Acidobacteriales bacterium]|nr:ABC transporter permease [Terriglobales bacterium]
MFLRLLYQSFLRQRRRKMLAGLAVMLGMTIVTAMVAVGIDVGDKINREFSALGPNIVVYPQEDTLDLQIGGVSLKPASEGAYLKESDLVQIKHTFWAHNIQAYSPFLYAELKLGSGADVPLIGTYFDKPVPLEYETITTGVRKTHPWWQVRGAWPMDDSTDVLIGRRLAAKLALSPGSKIESSGRVFRVAGVLSTDGAEDDAIIAPIALVQQVIGRPGAVRRVLVRALTKPEDDFGRRDPQSMSGEVLERWMCSPYANTIAHQISQAVPGAQAEQIRQVAQNEGVLLSRISGLMWLVALAGFGASTLAVASAMATTIFERRREIGLMKSLGAGQGLVASLFLAEAFLLALAGGLAGYFLGGLLARRIGLAVFSSSIAVQPVLLPFILMLAAVVTFAGSLAAIRKAVRFDPAVILRGETA